MERLPGCPSLLFKHRLIVELVDLAQAQHRHRLGTGRQQKQLTKLFRIEQRDPSHTDPFGPGGQPQVLNGTGDRCQIHLRQCASAEDMLFAPIHQRRHQDLSALQDAFDLESHEIILPLAQRNGRPLTLGLDQRMHTLSHGSISDMDETPRLHEADAGAEMRSLQQSCQKRRIERTRSKVTHIASFADNAIDGIDLNIAIPELAHGSNSN